MFDQVCLNSLAFSILGACWCASCFAGGSISLLNVSLSLLSFHYGTRNVWVYNLFNTITYVSQKSLADLSQLNYLSSGFSRDKMYLVLERGFNLNHKFFCAWFISRVNHLPVQVLQYYWPVEIIYRIPFRHFKSTAKNSVDNSIRCHIVKVSWCFIWSSCLSARRLWV